MGWYSESLRNSPQYEEHGLSEMMSSQPNTMRMDWSVTSNFHLIIRLDFQEPQKQRRECTYMFFAR